MSSYRKTINFWRDRNRENYANGLNQDLQIELTKRIIEILKNYVLEDRVYSLCELGAGSGRNLYYLQRLFPTWKLFANDLNENFLNVVKNSYPKLEDASLEIRDTLSYSQELTSVDIIFTFGHLMHLPNEIIDTVCQSINQKARDLIVCFEAFPSEWGKKKKYRSYRFERDYREVFNRDPLFFKILDISSKGTRNCLYIFDVRKKS